MQPKRVEPLSGRHRESRAVVRAVTDQAVTPNTQHSPVLIGSNDNRPDRAMRVNHAENKRYSIRYHLHRPCTSPTQSRTIAAF
jgi:hypothetical protein